MKIAGGFLVGAMLAFDMGGPINKTAWFFGFSLLSSHVYTWMGLLALSLYYRQWQLRLRHGLNLVCSPSKNVSQVGGNVSRNDSCN